MTDPTQDAERAVREARQAVCDAAASDAALAEVIPVAPTSIPDALDNLCAAVRQAERARIRGIVEGVPVQYQRGDRTWSDYPVRVFVRDLLRALSAD